MKTNTHAFGSTFAFFANAQSHKKMQKSYQANAPRHDQMSRQTTYEQKGRTANS